MSCVVSPEHRAIVGKIATENGNAAAVSKYSTGESTVQLIKTKYLAAKYVLKRKMEIASQSW